jgi:hypothetical protein
MFIPMTQRWKKMAKRTRTRYSKEEADYTDDGSKEEHCSICSHYVNPTTCDIVVGRIAPGGWCKHFDKEKK